MNLFTAPSSYPVPDVLSGTGIKNKSPVPDKLSEWFDNALTGERDFNREKELLNLSNAFNANQAQISREFNANQAQISRDFTREMSNTAYSRAVADLKKIGLNPYSILSPASTPNSAVASSSPARSSSGSAGRSGAEFMSLLTSVIGSAFSLAKTSMDNTAMLKRQELANSGYIASQKAKSHLSQVDNFNRWGERVGSTWYHYDDK